MKDDLIRRQDAVRVVSGLDSSFVKYIEELSPAKPEPCEDCVSRKAVIRLLHSGYHRKSMIEEVKELSSAQPEQKWIPCSERLPEELLPVLVAVKEKDRKAAWVAEETYHYVTAIDVLDDGIWNYGRNVTAWMPLPEPYEGGTK